MLLNYVTKLCSVIQFPPIFLYERDQCKRYGKVVPDIGTCIGILEGQRVGYG